MFEPDSATRRNAALAWLRENPNLATPWNAAHAGHTVTQDDCLRARAAAAVQPPPRTPWERFVDATASDPAIQEHNAHAEGQTRIFEARRDQRAHGHQED